MRTIAGTITEHPGAPAGAKQASRDRHFGIHRHPLTGDVQDFHGAEGCPTLIADMEELAAKIGIVRTPPTDTTEYFNVSFIDPEGDENLVTLRREELAGYFDHLQANGVGLITVEKV